MIWTFILGGLAGWGAPYAEERLKEPLERHLSSSPMPAVELRAITLSVCLLGAAIVAMLTSSAHAVPLTLGACLGVLWHRAWGKFRAMRAPDYDS